jgi:oligoribonuclease NrnB/cAMP/cGMP phosphodiesterase (DHH superfamily)
MDPSEIDYVIYHGNCSDGFTSALACYLYFKASNGYNKHGNKIEYYPAFHGSMSPNVEGKNVLICDFSYKEAIILNMISKSKNLLIIDHHKSAEFELKSIPDKNKIFNMDHSGCVLTWQFFYPDQDIPLLFKYVEDNDIWLKQMPNTREITSYIFSLPFDFEEYSKLLDDEHLYSVIPVATGFAKQNKLYIDQSMKHVSKKFIKFDNKYHMVGLVNSSVLKSEIGNCVFSKYPNCDFSGVYSIIDSKITTSLRSTNDRTDVSLIATKLGGGGHRNASGITSYGNIFDDVIDTNNIYNMLNNIYFKDNIVFLNSPYHKIELSKYLLQTRTIENNLNVQECCSINRNKMKNDTYINCDISCIWHYADEKTYITIAYNNNVYNDKYDNLFASIIKSKYYEDTVISMYEINGKINF